MNIQDLITPRAIAAYYAEAYSNKINYLGEALFPRRKKAGLDLSWINRTNGVPVSLAPSTFDAKATYRDRVGVTKTSTEMPFFREGMKITEKDRQNILRATESNDPYVAAAIEAIYDDVATLIAAAAVVPERMRMQLLFPVNGALGITIKANGVDYTYNYDGDGSWASSNYTALTGNAKWDAPSTSDPIAALQAVKAAIATSSGAELNTVIMNTVTYNKMASSEALLDRIKFVPYVTDAEIKMLLRDALGANIIVYDKQYKNESGVQAKFVPDGYVAYLPSEEVGSTWFGTTPEEADLMGTDKAEVSIVDTGVAVSREIIQHPVNINTIVSEIVLPSYERKFDVACIKAF